MPIEHLPERYRAGARRVRDWLQSDKGLLLLAFSYAGARFVSYLTREEPGSRHVLEMPEWLPATIWGVTAALCGLAMLRTRCERLEMVALCVVVGVSLVWGTLFLFSTPSQFLSRGSVFIAVAAMTIYTVWRGESQRLRIRGEHDGGGGD